MDQDKLHFLPMFCWGGSPKINNKQHVNREETADRCGCSWTSNFDKLIGILENHNLIKQIAAEAAWVGEKFPFSYFAVSSYLYRVSTSRLSKDIYSVEHQLVVVDMTLRI